MILQIGQIIQKNDAAKRLVSDIKKEFDQLSDKNSSNLTPKKAAYLIWRKPYMVAAKGTFIDDMLQKAGLINAFGELKRYPVVSEADLQNVKADVLLLSSEPFPFAEKHLEELQNICPNSVIKLVDGELFSWYGNRLLLSAPYFLNLRDELQI